MRKLDLPVIHKIKNLRKRGASYSDIKSKLNVGYGSIHRYTRDVSILPEYIGVWREKRKSSKRIAEKRKRTALEEARKQLKTLNNRNWLIALVALYWAEGTKTDLSFSNTDGEMVSFFVEAMERVFKVKRDELRVTIRIYEDLNRQQCLTYWAEKIGIHKSQILNVNVLKGKKQGKLKYGMCRVRIKKGGRILNRLHAYSKVLGDKARPHSLMDRARVS